MRHGDPTDAARTALSEAEARMKIADAGRAGVSRYSVWAQANRKWIARLRAKDELHERNGRIKLRRLRSPLMIIVGALAALVVCIALMGDECWFLVDINHMRSSNHHH